MKEHNMAEKIYLVGIGMGGTDGFTLKAKQLIEQSDLLCGAARMVEAAGSLAYCQEKETFLSYRAEEISAYLRAHREYVCPVVLLSGDVGFYSGASKLLSALEGFDVELVPGISTLSYFCARLKLSWENISYTSCHGRNANLIYRICRERNTFALLSGEKDLYELADKLLYYGMNQVILHIGERLSYEEERIYHLKAGEVREHSFGRPVAVVAENPSAKEGTREAGYREIQDGEFIRGDVPMTKCEVRTVSIAKLRLAKDSVLYDIGAGTGSVSIQAAANLPDGKVYAVEKKEDAVSLIEANKRKFAADNVEIIKGEAPGILRALPKPTHAFIGGSAGNMKEILDELFDANPRIRIVLNAISLETVSEVLAYFHGREEQIEDILQIAVSKAKQAGKHHLLVGQNPITVMVLNGREETPEKEG